MDTDDIRSSFLLDGSNFSIGPQRFASVLRIVSILPDLALPVCRSFFRAFRHVCCGVVKMKQGFGGVVASCQAQTTELIETGRERDKIKQGLSLPPPQKETRQEVN